MRWVGRLFSIMHDCLAQKRFIAAWGPVIHDIIGQRRQRSDWLTEGAARSTYEKKRRCELVSEGGFQCRRTGSLQRWTEGK